MPLSKSEILGMPHGTANGRLYRLVLFKVVKKAGLDTCIRCGEKIETAFDLSIEYIKPWQSPELFWDLDNIGFSHRTCNYGGAWRGKRAPNAKRQFAPLGMGWCSGHQTFLPRERFNANRTRPDALSDYCKECRRSHGG